MTPEQLEQLAADYVLGTLSASRRAEVQQRLPHDPALREAVQFWEQRLQPLTDLVEPVPPSPELWSRIEASVAPRRAAVPAASPAPVTGWRALWNNLALWRGVAAAGVAAAAFLAAVPMNTAAPRSQYLVVLVAPNNTAPGWVVQTSGQRTLRLQPLASTEVPQERSLQFWTKADGWTAPLSLGLVQPGQPLEVPLDKLPPLQPNQLFEITLEPYNGSPTGKPTGPILYIGRSVKLTT